MQVLKVKIKETEEERVIKASRFNEELHEALGEPVEVQKEPVVEKQEVKKPAEKPDFTKMKKAELVELIEKM